MGTFQASLIIHVCIYFRRSYMYVYIHDTYTCVYIYTRENMVYRIYDYYRALTEDVGHCSIGKCYVEMLNLRDTPLAPNPETLPSAWALKLNGNIIGGSASSGSETCKGQ